ncbi:MAG: SRPBCC domain-containing protein [Candidatus Saccharibacteria bacterium]
MQSYKKYFKIAATPADVYNALTNKHMLEIWTGEEAVMEEVPGTEFSLWEDSICGMNLVFEKNFKIVQEWYFGEEDEDKKSIVTIKLHPDKNGTSMEVTQTNIPDEAYRNISEGWEEDYFNGLNQLFEE